MASQVNSTLHFKKLMLILLKLFQKIMEKEVLPNSLYESNITLIPKSDKDIPHTQKNYRPISMMQKSSTKYWKTKSSNT